MSKMGKIFNDRKITLVMKECILLVVLVVVIEQSCLHLHVQIGVKQTNLTFAAETSKSLNIF